MEIRCTIHHSLHNGLIFEISSANNIKKNLQIIGKRHFTFCVGSSNSGELPLANKQIQIEVQHYLLIIIHINLHFFKTTYHPAPLAGIDLTAP
jgi:hypothetical protein